MEIGMLWYDNSPTALKDRVKQAASYYSDKYGRKPNLCFVHPEMLQADEGEVNGIVIRKGKQIMPGHFWIGVDEAERLGVAENVPEQNQILFHRGLGKAGITKLLKPARNVGRRNCDNGKHADRCVAVLPGPPPFGIPVQCPGAVDSRWPGGQPAGGQVAHGRRAVDCTGR